MLIDGAPLEAPAAPLHDLLAVGLAAGPDETAMVSAEERVTWRELEDPAYGSPARLPGLGLRAGRPDRLPDAEPHRPVVHYLACFKAGLVATPLNYRYTPREIDHALEVSGAAAIVAHAERAEDLAARQLAGGLARDRSPADAAATAPTASKA